ncbi:MAG: DciA family protein [Rhodospirillales bacterium]|jgi:hypothetical protein|nr:DciA family protein [Rhodospirillales bacterium]
MAEAKKRHHGVRAIGATLEKLTKPIFGRRGFDQAAIITDWPAIIGGLLASQTRPERIAHEGRQRTEGTLHLRLANSALAPELQHLEPQLVERINTYFGYRAVGRIRIHHGPIATSDRPELPPRRDLDPAEAEDLRARLDSINDTDLKAALEDLGSEILRSGAPSGDKS